MGRAQLEPEGPPPLPFLPGDVSNGEFVPRPLTAREHMVIRGTLAGAAEAAHRVGMDRRRFLQSAGGMAVLLGTINLAACASGDRDRRAAGLPTSTSAWSKATDAPGGTYEVPEPEDTAACDEALGDHREFIFDVHTHHVMPDRPWRQNAPRIADMIRGLVPAGCVESDPFTCVDRVAYLHDVFLASDTTVALLSDVPNSGPADAPVPFADAVGTHDLADRLTAGGATRVLVHNVIAPNFGHLGARLDDMAATAATGDVTAFKVYTAWGPGGRGYALDDPAIGLPVVERARELGVRVMCAHKGLPLLEFDHRHNGPADMVACAALYPDMDFVVYHSAYERETVEGPYDPAGAATGIDSLVKALRDRGTGPNANVWAELGTTWREVMSDPDQAAHVLGKLLLHVGEDRVLWGTDAIWYGSPQPQIMAFRAFQITPEYQERYGYPALTEEVKAKIFGLNAAHLFGLDPAATRCALSADGLDTARAEVRRLAAAGALPALWQPRGPITRREVLGWLSSPSTRWTPW
ncbi:MAG TPA: amidohydrolase family protein [Acidimicrobiales bacterium]|nr:amidohydrolase family protein [Acidimicrobiales bacterium]